MRHWRAASQAARPLALFTAHFLWARWLHREVLCRAESARMLSLRWTAGRPQLVTKEGVRFGDPGLHGFLVFFFLQMALGMAASSNVFN